MENEFNFSSAASVVVGLNVLGDGINYLDFEIENSSSKLLNRVPSKLLNVDSENSVLSGSFPFSAVARGERVTARVYAREDNTVDVETDIILILKV